MQLSPRIVASGFSDPFHSSVEQFGLTTPWAIPCLHGVGYTSGTILPLSIFKIILEKKKGKRKEKERKKEEKKKRKKEKKEKKRKKKGREKKEKENKRKKKKRRKRKQKKKYIYRVCRVYAPNYSCQNAAKANSDRLMKEYQC